MNRILAFLTAVLTFCTFSINCSAAEYNKEVSNSVYGKYNYYSNEDIYTANYENGKYSITTDSGITVIVYSSKTDLTLVVHQISSENEDFYNWFYNNISEDEKNPIPFDIYFINSLGERIELSSNDTVEIQMSNSYQHVSKLTLDGESYSVNSSKDSGYLIFNADDTSGYYFVSEYRELLSPNTGNDNIISFGILIILIPITFLIILQYKKRHIAS